jgi:hypothetical protein
MAYARPEVFTGRRGIDANGCRFLLNPTPHGLASFFSGFEGAAFIRIGDDVSFGAGPNGSIDHSTIATSFALHGEELFRGYATIGGDVQIETWTNADRADDLDPAELERIETRWRTAIEDPCLSRLPGGRGLLVFSLNHGQPIIERSLQVPS